MKSMRIVTEQQPLVLHESGIPEPPAKGLVVQIKYAGVCHSDLNQWKNEIDTGYGKRKFTDNPKYRFPITPGHEIAGIVRSFGAQAERGNLTEGDAVIVYPWIGCEECVHCAHDNRSLCNQRQNGLGIGTPGGYSTHVSVCDAKFALKVDVGSIPLHFACLLPCSGLTTFNAVTTLLPSVEKMTRVKGYCSVLIVGAGGLGLWCLEIAKHVYPSTTRIVVADISEANLAEARSRGCDDTVLWSRDKDEDDVIAETKAKAIDAAFDGAIDVVNNTVTAQRVFKSTNRGAHVVLVGLFGGAGTFPLLDFVHGMRTVQGILTGNLQQLSQLLALFSTKSIRAPPVQQWELQEAYEALCGVRDGKVKGRYVLKCS